MADEPIKPNPPVDTAALMAEVEALRKSNREILDDYKKAKEAAKAVPPDVDVDALIAFKQQKEKAGNDVSRWRYSDWVNDNLTIALAKGTSVLELAYRDTDDQLILPVIEQISKAYQAYSGRDRERGISLAIDYLDQQIGIYRPRVP